ncbi:hypothetical protein SCOR_07270 [Sulfidibacter corallicola]
MINGTRICRSYLDRFVGVPIPDFLIPDLWVFQSPSRFVGVPIPTNPVCGCPHPPRCPHPPNSHQSGLWVSSSPRESSILPIPAGELGSIESRVSSEFPVPVFGCPNSPGELGSIESWVSPELGLDRIVGVPRVPRPGFWVSQFPWRVGLDRIVGVPRVPHHGELGSIESWVSPEFLTRVPPEFLLNCEGRANANPALRRARSPWR